MTASLSESDKAAIRSLKQSDIEQTTAGLRRFINNSSWIGKNNYYNDNVVSRLKKSAPTTKTHKRNLAQYIDASVTLHANDGWSYLGRAASCILSGDSHRAVHLAYYAELRAAMSLLAGSGIGIFNQKHFIIPQANLTTKLETKYGTHVVAWLALEEWSQLSTSGELFAEIVRPDGGTLDQWFQSLGGANTLAARAKSWFMQWGMDIGLGTMDREARNESSYRPDGVPITWIADAKVSLDFIRDMWRLLEPSTTSSFEQIDRHILRLAIESFFRGSKGKKVTTNNYDFEIMVNKTISTMSLLPSTEERLKKFLHRQVSPTNPLVFYYSAEKPGKSTTGALAVFSRALLLLRLATGSAHRLLDNSGIDAETLSFWWTRLGESRGIWDPGTPPSDLHDLWADVEQSLNEISEIENVHPHLLRSFSSIALNLAPNLKILTSHERVGIWGLCSS